MFKLGTKVVVVNEAESSIQGMHGTVKQWSSKNNSVVELYDGTRWVGTKRLPNTWIKAR